jgi:predicted TIM-barrel fold metal-dependent hydrolase
MSPSKTPASGQMLSAIAREYVQFGKSETCPLIDMHGHYGPFPGSYLPAAPEQVMLHKLERAGVKRIVCSHHTALLVDITKGNALMQAAIDRHPDMLLGYWAINPNFPELAARAGKDYEQSHGFVGFKFLSDYHAYPLTGKAYAPALEYANEHRLLVLAHTWGGSPYDSPQLLGEIAQRYPSASFLMGHSGHGDWENSVRVAQECPNVSLELTAVFIAHDFAMEPAGSGTPVAMPSCLHVNGIIEYMVEHASSRKVVFGTDMPWYSPHYAAGAVLFAHIDDEARHDILHRNGERLLAAVGRPSA